ncbi:AAA family ATPase [Rhodococcus ruber]|uniref:AAA domain-containing protein n=1 Tax=Rhodococcus sp. P14 TaxID=450821 RepID=UPI000299F1EE|nr:AAA domain-containing protein [Rhodococcus sp. P14]ATQ31562.1 AAA family ATPase [Rhodococcus ruber]
MLAFLSELVKARSAPVRVVDKHRAMTALDEGNLDVALSTDASAGDVVLRARRVHLEDPPRPPAAVTAWIRGSTADSTTEPTLDPDVPDTREFDAWLTKWRAWAEVDRERRPAWHLHAFLQRALLDLEAQPESLELVIASGLLQLSADFAGEQVRTHLITQPTLVERDSASGDLLVRLDPESGPALEDTQLLTGLEVFDSSGTRSLHESLAARVSSPVDPAARIFLKDWSDRALTTRVEVVDRPDEAASPDRLLTPSPSLVLRKRGAYALTEYYDRMTAAAADETTAVPLGLAQLVEAIEPADRVAWLDRAGTSSSLLADDPLFPLPANQEQRDIIDRLAGDSGVVVEGPPGTGKTHTIANLVSALLARGQRVLVTSEKAQALRVLRDKLPLELQELCVSVTDAGRGGSAELNRSVSEIATRKAQFDPRRTAARIDEVAQRRDTALSRRAMLTERIRQARASETLAHADVAPGYAGTPAEIVRKVTAQSANHDWLRGSLGTDTPPLSPEGFQTLLALSERSRPGRAERRRQHFPDLELPSLSDLELACEAVRNGPGSGSVPTSGLLRMLEGAAPDVLERIREQCDHLQRALIDVDGLEPAFRNLADAVLSGGIDYLWDKTAHIRELVTVAYNADVFLGTTTVVDTPVVGRNALHAYDALARALEGGETWRSGLARFRRSNEQTTVEALGRVATVDGVEATTAPLARAVAEHLRALDAIQSVALILRDLGVEIDTSGSRSQMIGAAARAARARDLVEVLATRTREVELALQQASPGAPRIASLDQARSVATAAQAIAAAGYAQANRSWLTDVASRVRARMTHGIPPEGHVLVRAIESAEFGRIRTAIDSWHAAVREYQEELHLESLQTRLSDAAPALAQAVADNPSSAEWSVRLNYIEQAWAWRLAYDWVQQHSYSVDDQHLQHELDATENDIAQLTAQLAAERAWSACLERTTAAQVQALQTYRDHVASIGKGTGKYAERFRAGAREAMQVAQQAVPAWVMPLQQVLASIPAEQNSFDVVIVDEASQADISSLFLLWLAPRVIVVGDDKQCAPSDVSSGALEGVFTRLDSYLPDIPKYLRDSFTPRSSVFSLLRSRFGSVIRLREHFRCMPEIINWSSGQFYADAPLVPVRQFGADRLPPLRTTYVEGGVVTGRNATLSNRVEARAIADTVKQCLSDEAYDGKTFGVVVLQGQAQVDVITNELLDRLTPEQWEERRLRVGTPPDFQGDERHVVFLSMVVAPEQNIMAMTKTEYQRRFNVAASRAQDQMWLFHSRTVESLRSTDLRHSLLTYMQSTSPAPAEPMPEGVTRDDRHHAFDSLFEQRVFLDIVARGYHVNPQVEANGRRIDLVVTGAAGKLAVECDGDHWHKSPEQQRADLERERELQRCGWQFWRIRESEYYLDPVGSMRGLWEELDRRGIRPHVVGVNDVVTAVQETWTPVELVEDDSPVDDVADALDQPILPPEPAVETTEPQPVHVEVPAPPTAPSVHSDPEILADPAPVVPEVEPPTVPQEQIALATAITTALAEGPLPVSKIAARLGEDWKVVLADLDRLIAAGRVGEVAVFGKLTQYHLLDAPLGEVEDAPASTLEESPPNVAVPEPAAEQTITADEPQDLATSIVELLASGPLPVGKIAEQVGEHWRTVHAGLDQLLLEGRIEEVTAFGKLTEYHLVDVASRTESSELPLPPDVGSQADTPALVLPPVQTPVVPGWETISASAIESLPPSLGSRIGEQLSSGPVSLADLEFRLNEPRERIEAVVDELIARGRAVLMPERGPRVYALAPPADRAVANDESAPTPQSAVTPRAVSVADLPPARLDSVAEILITAAAIADLSVERAMKLSRLDHESVMQIISSLEADGKLVRRDDASGPVWGRGDR